MARYISAARAQLAALANKVSDLDPAISHERPALTEFMTCCETEEGGVRELSVLMVVAGTDGLRVGLRDDDMGGWLWRTGSTLSDCLDALEVTLQDGSGRWGRQGDRIPKKGRK